MHHVTLESMEAIREFPDEEIHNTCVALEQSIYSEISKRLAEGKMDLTDPSNFYKQIRQYYDEVSTNHNRFSEDIQSSMLDMKKQRKTKKNVNSFKDKLEKRGNDFFKDYKKSFNLREPRSRMPVPSPDQIINGSSPSDVPNN
jgi:archaellum component FlaC